MAATEKQRRQLGLVRKMAIRLQQPFDIVAAQVVGLVHEHRLWCEQTDVAARRARLHQSAALRRLL